MSGKMPILYGALTLTGVNLLLRFVGTSFQVYISSVIGPAGVGLLQLILSVSSLCMTAGIAGVRTTAMYLTAEELGRKRPGNVTWIMSGCFLYCIVTSGTICLGLHYFAPVIAGDWIGDMDALPALRTFASFLPISCLCGVMTGYFTAANRIGTLAAVEVAEQFFSMGITVLSLFLLPHTDPAGACWAVVLGSCAGNTLTFLCLMGLYFFRKKETAPRIPVARRLLSAAVPLALADDLKAGISSVENLMVPKRLALYPGTADPLASFGILSGMVFPIMMFPAAILFSLSELLIPELARCAAADSRKRIRYLVRRNLRVSLFYGLICGAVLFLVSEPLCEKLYPGIGVAKYLKWFSVLIPMLYCDAVTDGMTKGLGQQKYCVRYNIMTNTLDVCLLFILLPRLGLSGYFASFFITHLLNFMLSLRRLVLVSGIQVNFYIPFLTAAAALLAVMGALAFTGWVRQLFAFWGLFLSISYFFGVLGPGDIQWVRGLLFPKHK